MKSWRIQRGEISVGCLIGFAVLIVVALIAIKTVPVMISVGEMQKEIEGLAERGNMSHRYRQDSFLHARIIDKSEDLRLRLSPENVKIERRSQDIRIRVEYDIEIRYPGYTYIWHKKHDVQRQLF
ncbi:MAG: hypothetical protein GY906_39215 [bacterium]|nr:hypothetical protein [bacterium]